jgi:hypothetical protein
MIQNRQQAEEKEAKKDEGEKEGEKDDKDEKKLVLSIVSQSVVVEGPS